MFNQRSLEQTLLLYSDLMCSWKSLAFCEIAGFVKKNRIKG